MLSSAVQPRRHIPFLLQFNPSYPIDYSKSKLTDHRRSRKWGIILMRDRSKNRKALQKGRTLSIEAIQTVQALKRAAKKEDDCAGSIGRVFNSQVRRLLKFDMVAVLRELVRQNECELALKVFEDVRKEDWYKPRLFLLTDLITALATNGMIEEGEKVLSTLKEEGGDLEPDSEGFNRLLRALVDVEMSSRLAVDCFRLMLSIECDPDKITLWKLVNYLESNREMELANAVREEAKQVCWSLDFLEEDITDDVLAA